MSLVAFNELAALLAEVARLEQVQGNETVRGDTQFERAERAEARAEKAEQERDEAHANTNEGLQWLRDDIAVKVETIASLEAALAVAREREQPMREALQACVGVLSALPRSAQSIRRTQVLAMARAALVDEPAADVEVKA